MNIQGQTIQSHNHTIAHTHTQQGTFNTDEKGGHTHTTNSQSASSFRTSTTIYDSNGTKITNTGGMSANSIGHMRTYDYTTPSRDGNIDVVPDYFSGASTYLDMSTNTNAKTALTVNVAHTHNMQHNHTVDIGHTHGTNEKGAHTHSVTISGSTQGSSNANSGSTGSIETRPDNYSYVIWKRIA